MKIETSFKIYKLKPAFQFTVYIFFVFALFLPNHVNCQPNWELARNRNGVLVYTKFYKSEGLKQLKAETTVSGVSLHSFAAVFKDVENTILWADKLKFAKCLKKISSTEYINYFITDIPWPLRRREGIFKINMYQDKNDNALVIESIAFPDFIPESDTAVRILEAKSIWKFTPIGDNNLAVQSIFYADPRGFPPFLVNLFVTDSPLQTMTNLREYVKQEKYKNAKFDFIKD